MPKYKLFPLFLIAAVFTLSILVASLYINSPNLLNRFSKTNLKESRESIAEYCKKSSPCDSKYCEGACVGGGPEFGCVLGCVPKDCQKYSVYDCPTDYCGVWKTSAGNEICYYNNINDNRDCGRDGYYGQKYECCEGYIRRPGKLLGDGTCDHKKGGYQDMFPYCIACGNGVCERDEDKCNCPEDCK